MSHLIDSTFRSLRGSEVIETGIRICHLAKTILPIPSTDPWYSARSSRRRSPANDIYPVRRSSSTNRWLDRFHPRRGAHRADKDLC